MPQEKPRKILFEETSRFNQHAIKNFIVSDNWITPHVRDVADDQPFIFDGVIFGVCVKGSGSFYINYKKYEVEENMVITIMPNHIFHTETRSDDMIVEFIFCSMDFLTELPLPRDYDIFFALGRNPCLEIPEHTAENLLEYHNLIVDRYKNIENPLREKIIRGLVYTMLLEIGVAYAQQLTPQKNEIKSSHQEELTEKFFKILMQHYHKERSVSFYADKMCLTPKYLSSTVKKVSGKSILEWINETVIVTIKNMLRTTDLSVLQISEEFNFPNPSYFGRFFKQYTGMTPMKYRNS